MASFKQLYKLYSNLVSWDKGDKFFVASFFSIPVTDEGILLNFELQGTEYGGKGN